MNKIEQLVYNTVKSNPGLKRGLRNIYQTFFDLLPSQKDFFKHDVKVFEGHYFGFHDVSPFSLDDKLLLSNRLTIPFGIPKKGDTLEIGYFEITENEQPTYRGLAETKAWNYHKGCRLQWVEDRKLIYNDVHNSTLGSTMYNIDNKEVIKYNFPIDSVSPNGQYATSFSYERLEKLMPGYGYAYQDESYLDEMITPLTGMYLMDLEKGSRELICSLEDLAQQQPEAQEISGYHHYVTHSLFSHDSRYVSFLHRWASIDNPAKRYSRLAVYDRENKSVHFSPTDGMVSHYVWNKKHQIIAYCRTEGIDSHVLFLNPEMKSYKRIAYPALNSDGHQSFVSDQVFVTDTYPDKYRMANLYTVDAETNNTELIARVNSPKKFQSIPACHWSCDLHPRMNHKGDIVCFDSVHTGNRSLCLMKI